MMQIEREVTDMTIKKIYYFCEICKDLNLSHTAKRLYVTQQSLSYVIRTLEQDLKCTLFYRTANGLQLTEQGNFFYARCTHILEELDETCSALRHVSQSSQSNLRISLDACVYNMMMHMLPNRCNDCDVEYSYYGADACLEHVQSGTVDGAILPQKFDVPDLQFTLLWRDPACVVLSKHHPLAQHTAISISQIAHEQLLVPQVYQPIYPSLFESCAKLGVNFQHMVSAPSPLVAIHKCTQGQGVLLLDQQSLKNCVITSPDIRILPVAEPLFINLYCAYPRQHISPTLSTFIQDIHVST